MIQAEDQTSFHALRRRRKDVRTTERRPAERIEFAGVIDKFAKLIEGLRQTGAIVAHLPDLKRELAR
jgi:hypothetical protein